MISCTFLAVDSVVSTRCGGPEDIVTEDVGALVPPEDPKALADGIEHVLDRRERHDADRLRAHALEHFGFDSVAERLSATYQDALSLRREPGRPTHRPPREQ